MKTINQRHALADYRASKPSMQQTPEDGGQIVCRTWGMTADYVFRRSVDQSDGETTIEAWQQRSSLHPDYQWCSANGAPPIGRRVGIIYRGVDMDAARWPNNH